nr:type II/IV secretion system protein [Bacilli bacterium]
MLKVFDFNKMPVVEVVNEILVDSSKRGASDIHFDPWDEMMKVRIRIDGALVDYCEVPNTIKKNLVTRIKIISGMNITESRLPQDGAIKATLQDIPLDLRVSCLPTSNGEKIVVRILDYSMSLAGLETLGFTEANYKKVLQMISVPNGIILVTGATGTGKSTTVYSILQKLNKEDTNIITVEDPIEMEIEGVNQVQVSSEIGLTFASALRSILRQDPNVIMVGEIRDNETAKIAVRASITGHIVLSTIHTNNSLNTIERLLDMEVERYLLASSLEGIISQKLARRLCPHCRTKRPTTHYEKELFQKVLHKEVNEIYSAEGCEQCGTGYKGRIALHEVLLINQEIRDALSEGMPKEKLRELVYKADVATLLQDGLMKVEAGYTTFEEVLKLIELDDDDLAGENDLRSAIDTARIALSEKEDAQKPNVAPQAQTTGPTPNVSAPSRIENRQIENAVE